MAEGTELMRRAAERVEAELLTPLRRTMGPDNPVERTASEVLGIVAIVERELATAWITLAEAAERSGYSYDTVNQYAKANADGEEVPEPWGQMQVRRRPDGVYEVQAGSVPTKPGRA